MIGMLRTVVLDAPDARRLAAFYTALGGWTEQDADDEWVTMETGDGWRIAAQRSPTMYQKVLERNPRDGVGSGQRCS